MDRHSISDKVYKKLRDLESELSFKMNKESFNPKRIVKAFYPLYFLNKNALNKEAIHGIENLLEKYEK